MANTIEIVIKATDNASQVIAGVESKVVGSTATLVKNLDEVGRASQTAQQKLQDFGKGMAGLGDKMSLGVTLPLVAAGTAAVKFASDLNETTSKVGVLFGDMSNDIKAWANTAATSFGLSKKAALDGASDFAIFGKAAGLAGKDLTDFSKSNVKLASDMASFFNTSPEEAITAIGAAFRGESEPIRRYGVLINDVALKDEALRQGLIKTTTDALTPQQRILAASALIMKQTGAAQGDFARTSDQLANSTRIAKAQLEDAAAALGTNLLPIVNKGVNFLNELLKAFQTLSPEMQTAILAFGGIAAAMGPIMSVGGRLIGVFTSLAPVVVDTAKGLLDTGKTVAETAGYLKEAGISSESLKFAFDNLKASGALVGIELGVIVAGLIAVAKYLQEVDAASKATNDSLIEMSRSGDVFKQAAATTEIYWHGQERLKKTLDDVRAVLETSGKAYDDYRSSIEATAKAAGYEIDANGNLIKVVQLVDGTRRDLIQTNYALTESEYIANKALHEKGGLLDQGLKKLIAYGDQLNALAAKQKESAASETTLIRTGNSLIDNSINLALAQRKLVTDSDALAAVEKDVEQSMKDAAEATKFYNNQIADTTVIAIQFTDSQKKQAEVQKELDTLNAKIASHGPARVGVIRDEKVTTEDLARAQTGLAVAQEDLATAQKRKGETDTEFILRIDTIKGKIADYSTILNGHIGVLGGATKAEQDQKKALEDQIIALQKADEVTRAKGAFDSLSKAFRDGILTQAQYEERMTALNKVTGMYTEQALAQAKAQEALMVSFADPRSELWRGQLLKNEKAIDGQVDSTKQVGSAADEAIKAASKATAGLSDLATGQSTTINKALDSTKKPSQDFITNAKNMQDEFGRSQVKAMELVNYGLSPMSSTLSVLTQQVSIFSQALGSLPGVAQLLPNYAAPTTPTNPTNPGGRTYPLVGGAQYGADFVVPPNPRGGMGDYYPVVAAPGERVQVTPRGQGNGGNIPVINITQNFSGAQSSPEQYRSIMYDVMNDVIRSAMNQ